MKGSSFRTSGWARPQSGFRTLCKCSPPVLGAALYALTVFWLTATPALAIVNGTPDDGEPPIFPNVGAIVATEVAQEFQDLGVQAPQAISSGTLIHPRVLLTAGHSVAYMNDLVDTYPELTQDDFVVSFEPDVSGEGADGDLDFSIPIEDVAIHPDFTIPQNSNSLDVGVIFLSEPVTGIDPVRLPELPKEGEKSLLDDLVDSGNLSVDGTVGTPLPSVGYGATEESASDEVPFTDALILPSGKRHFGPFEFQALRQNNLVVSQVFIGEAHDAAGGAPGDSGGPVFWRKPDTGELTQVGLVSWGDVVATSYGAPARLDVPEVLNWINDDVLPMAGSTSGTAGVPEPSTVLLLSLAAVPLALRFPIHWRSSHVSK